MKEILKRVFILVQLSKHNKSRAFTALAISTIATGVTAYVITISAGGNLVYVANQSGSTN